MGVRVDSQVFFTAAIVAFEFAFLESTTNLILICFINIHGIEGLNFHKTRNNRSDKSDQ